MASWIFAIVIVCMVADVGFVVLGRLGRWDRLSTRPLRPRPIRKDWM